MQSSSRQRARESDTGRKRGQTQNDVETEGKTADEGQWGFPLCRIRKVRRKKKSAAKARSYVRQSGASKRSV